MALLREPSRLIANPTSARVVVKSRMRKIPRSLALTPASSLWPRRLRVPKRLGRCVIKFDHTPTEIEIVLEILLTIVYGIKTRLKEKIK